MKILLGILLVFGTYFGASFFLNTKIPQWKTDVAAVLENLDEISFDRVRQVRETNVSKLPSFYPFSCLHEIFESMEDVFFSLESIKKMDFPLTEKKVEITNVWTIFESLESIKLSLHNIRKNVEGVPSFLLSTAQEEKRKEGLTQLYFLENLVDDVLKFEKIIRQFVKKNERVLILLQNQNEPRSSGGFVGSFIVLDFEAETVHWDFLDVYAFDRKVPLESQLYAPDFFHTLSSTISLRDANFWPDFSVSAQKYQYFFESIQEKSPSTVLAVNLNFVSELLKLTGPVKMEKWNLELNAKNFDLGLQFLVESKIAGRFAVKEPVEIFMQIFGSKMAKGAFDMQQLKAFDWREFMKQKNILAYSSQRSLQKLFEKWMIDGNMRQKKEVDNFLYFDFVSVGANKSEKFMWTKIWHDSEIHKDGRVRNTLSIKRTHALKPDEIQKTLQWNQLPQNVQDLMTDDLLWKLGAGENRTVLRLYVPKNAQLVFYDNLSGKVGKTLSEDKQFQIFEVPLNVLPQESLETEIVYETKIERGSQNWRPYFLQVGGTPGKIQTTFLSTISTEKDGKFSAETKNIGLPQNLHDMDFRALVEF